MSTSNGFRLRAVPRADLVAAALLCACAGVLYGTTLCRSVYWYDSAEYATAAFTLGVPHPPGYPVYTLIAHAFVRILPGSPALAVNALSAAAAVLALLLCYANARELACGPLAAAIGAALLATGPSFWFNATVAEVYAPGLCVALCALWLLLRAQRLHKPRLAVLAAGLCGLGMGVHYSLATLGLGYASLAAQSAPVAPPELRARGVLKVIAACAIAALVAFGLDVVLLVLRANVDVQPNQAHPLGVARVLWLITGGNYRLWFANESNFLERIFEIGRLLVRELSRPGALLALVGIVRLARRAPLRATALLLAMVGNLAFFFRYRVHDLEVFLLPTVALLAVSAGLGAQALVDSIAARLRSAYAARAVSLVLLAIPCARVWTDFGERNLGEFHEAHDYGERLSAQLPYSAVILNYTTPDEWKYDAVFGLYFQQVLGRRRDVTVTKSAKRAVVDQLLAEGRAVFLYAPVAHVNREYAITRQGDLYRVGARR